MDMRASLSEILKLETPVVVRLGERRLPLQDVLSLAPGSIIELPQHAEDELTLLINNKPIGLGHAVKVGENFGLRLSFIGDIRARLEALTSSAFELEEPEEAAADLDAEALAEQFLAGQL